MESTIRTRPPGTSTGSCSSSRQVIFMADPAGPADRVVGQRAAAPAR